MKAGIIAQCVPPNNHNSTTKPVPKTRVQAPEISPSLFGNGCRRQSLLRHRRQGTRSRAPPRPRQRHQHGVHVVFTRTKFVDLTRRSRKAGHGEAGEGRNGQRVGRRAPQAGDENARQLLGRLLETPDWHMPARHNFIRVKTESVSPVGWKNFDM